METLTFINQHLKDFNPFIHQTLVFVHLYAFAFAIVMIVSEDVKILISKKIVVTELHSLASKVTHMLIILWLTGIGLLAMKPGLNIEMILANSKLAAKITVVSVLTINGLLLHLLVFPNFSTRKKAKRIVALACVLTAISTTSWIYASLVGAARVIAPLMSYEHYMTVYLTALAFSLFISLTIVYPVMRKIIKTIDYSNQSTEFQLSTSSFVGSLRELQCRASGLNNVLDNSNHRPNAVERYRSDLR